MIVEKTESNLRIFQIQLAWVCISLYARHQWSPILTGTSGETVVGVIVVGANVGAIVEGEFVIGEDVEGELVELPLGS